MEYLDYAIEFGLKLSVLGILAFLPVLLFCDMAGSVPEPVKQPTR